MSKKKEMKAFQEGMEAGAKPFEDKFEQHAKELKKSKKEIMHQVNEIGLVQDEMLDIEEEHEEMIKRINEKVQYGLKDKESLEELEKGEKEVLGGLLVELSKQFDFNDKQQQFTANVLRILGISNPQDITLDVIEDVENITVQKVLYRVIMEVLFLENSSSDFSEEAEDVFDYFSISGKQKTKIKEETENFYRAVGDNGLINKYFVSEEELQKKKKSIPKLEVDSELAKFVEYRGSLIPYLTVEDSNDYLSENCTSYDEAENRYEEVIEENFDIMISYMSDESSNYLGRKAADFYCEEITDRINHIIDYINANKLHINITDLMEMRDDCEDEIQELADDEMESMREIHSSHAPYMLGRKIDEDEDYVETFFGGMKEVTVYQPSYDTVWKAVEQMTADLRQAIETFDMQLWSAVVNKYMLRILDVRNQINAACGNDED